MNNGFVTSALCVIGACSAVVVAGAAEERIETFQPPERTVTVNPVFPRASQRRLREGWVTLTMMIDPQGLPYDVAVANSSGGGGFEEAAIKAAQQWRYEPATFDGEPIDAGTMVKIQFGLSGQAGARRSFRNRYRDFQEAMDAGDQQQAQALLGGLDNGQLNLFETSYLHLAQYTYHARWGTAEQQYAALRKASFVDGRQEFLPTELQTRVMLSELQVALKLNLLGAARATAGALLDRELTEEQREFAERALTGIEQAAQAEGYLMTNGRIAGGNRFFHRLLKSQFTFEAVEGDIAELRLHCERGYVGFVYQAGMSYSVDDALRGCVLTVIGDPDTTFALIEL